MVFLRYALLYRLDKRRGGAGDTLFIKKITAIMFNLALTISLGFLLAVARSAEALIVGVYFFGTDKRIGFRLKDLPLSGKGYYKKYFVYSVPVLVSDGLLAAGPLISLFDVSQQTIDIAWQLADAVAVMTVFQTMQSTLTF